MREVVIVTITERKECRKEKFERKIKNTEISFLPILLFAHNKNTQQNLTSQYSFSHENN